MKKLIVLAFVAMTLVACGNKNKASSTTPPTAPDAKMEGDGAKKPEGDAKPEGDKPAEGTPDPCAAPK